MKPDKKEAIVINETQYTRLIWNLPSQVIQKDVPKTEDSIHASGLHNFSQQPQEDHFDHYYKGEQWKEYLIKYLPIRFREGKNMEDKKHIVAITAFIKNQKGDKFLIVQRGANEVAYPSKWAYVGGKLEKGESFMQTLKREVLEETGIEIEAYKRFLKDFTFVRPDGHNVVGACFLVKALTENVKISKDFEDYKWITPEELKNFEYIEGMEEEMQLAFAIKE